MKQLLRSSTTSLGAIIAIFLLVLTSVVTIVAVRANAADTTPRSGTFITIHDRGTEKAFISSAHTIGDALKEANIDVAKQDVVEPAASQELVASQYQVNIYRARPVLVIDGEARQTVMTPYQTADQITSTVGITLYPEDQTTITRSNDIIAEGAGLTLTIKRAKIFHLTLYGKQSDVRTQGRTVGDMLKEKNISLSVDDRVSPDSSTLLTSDTQVTVWREGKQTVTVEEPLAFETDQIRDANQLTSYKQVQTTGQNGTQNVTYEIIIRDGQEVSRTKIASIVTKESSKQVEIIGTKVPGLPYTGGGTKTEWLAASNIPEESWGYADFMVQKESGWNPNSINKSSGACGLAQALPCSKVPGNPYNPVDSLNWMNSYVNGRYGGWLGAYTFWNANHWY